MANGHVLSDILVDFVLLLCQDLLIKDTEGDIKGRLAQRRSRTWLNDDVAAEWMFMRARAKGRWNQTLDMFHRSTSA